MFDLASEQAVFALAASATRPVWKARLTNGRKEGCSGNVSMPQYPTKKLQSKYSDARNHAWLLPVAWANHLISGTWKLFRFTVLRANISNVISTDKRTSLF